MTPDEIKEAAHKVLMGDPKIGEIVPGCLTYRELAALIGNGVVEADIWVVEKALRDEGRWSKALTSLICPDYEAALRKQREDEPELARLKLAGVNAILDAVQAELGHELSLGKLKDDPVFKMLFRFKDCKLSVTKVVDQLISEGRVVLLLPDGKAIKTEDLPRWSVDVDNREQIEALRLKLVECGS